MSEQTLNLLDLIRQRLRATARRIQQAELAQGFAITLGILASIWLVLTAIEAGFWLETTSRSVLFWAIVLVMAGLIGYFVVLPLLRYFEILPGPSEETVAAWIGERYPDVSDRLVNMLHLANGQRSESPDAFVDRAVRMLGEQVRSVPFEQVENFEQARRTGRFAGVPLAGLFIFLLAAPSTFLGANERLLSPGTYFERPAPFSLSVEPGSAELIKGESLEIVIRAEGQPPNSLTVLANNLDEDHVEEVQLTPDSTGVFRHTLINVRKPMRYRVAASPVRTPWYEVSVAERPLIRGLQVALEFPGYTRIPARSLEPNVGDVSALAGTRVSVDVTVGNGTRGAYLEFDDGSRDTLSVDQNRASGSFVLRNDGAYRIVLENEQDIQNDNPIAYTLTSIQDAAPSIALLEPQGDAVLTEALETPIRSRIVDDFGFSRLQLHYRLAESRFSTPSETFEILPLPLQDAARLDQDVLYTWLLSQSTELDPVPGDVIEYYLQVWDNDTFTGPKSARTDVYRLRLPTLAEQYQEIEQQQDEAQGELESLLDETQSIREQFQELRDELRSKQGGDWQDQRQLQQLQQQQQRLEERVESLSEQVESATQKMQENNLVSGQTLQQYQELQKVIDEINSPELQEALRQLQEAMQQLNLQQLQESIGKFEFTEQQFQQRLERTLELFKKLRMQQGLDEASRRAEELARLQEELAKQTGDLLNEDEASGPGDEEDAERAPQDERQKEAETGEDVNETGQNEQAAGEEDQTSTQEKRQQSEGAEQQQTSGEPQRNGSTEQLASEQERSSQEMRELEQELEEMARKMEELRRGPKEEMQRLSEQTRQQELSQKMQQNAQQLQENQLKQAQSGQQQMQQQLQQLQQQLQQMQQGMQGQQQQVNMAGLRRALEDVLTLSKNQEDLHANVRSLSGDTPQVRDLARQQIELSEALRVVSDSLQKLSRDIPQMSREVQQQAGDALRTMRSATDAMSERMIPEATGHQQASMMHLNESALLLSDLMNQLMNSSSGSGEGMSMQQMQQQLQQMAGQQQQLNQQIQEMLNQMQGDRLPSDMQQRLQQMASQQRAIQEQLKQLNRDPNARGNLLGDLNRVAEQMEETIRELQNNQLDRPIIERQQQILTRLLDAQKSLQERGKEEKRQGRSGQDTNRESPADLPREEQIEKLRRDLLRALESGYAPDYEELIKRYFELLQDQSQPQEDSN